MAKTAIKGVGLVGEQIDDTRALGGGKDAGDFSSEFRHLLRAIYGALQEKGYDPLRQIAHFLLTGEPTYITAHKNARSLAQKLERDEVLEELLRAYLNVPKDQTAAASE